MPQSPKKLQLKIKKKPLHICWEMTNLNKQLERLYLHFLNYLHYKFSIIVKGNRRTLTSTVYYFYFFT